MSKSLAVTTKIVSAAVPAGVKVEAAAVLAAHGVSMATIVRELLARVASRDAGTLAWLHEARRRQELDALVDAATAAADRAAELIDEVLSFVEASNKRIAAMESKASRASKAARTSR